MSKVFKIVCFSFALTPFYAFSAHVSCDLALQTLTNEVEENYAGYVDNNRDSLELAENQLRERIIHKTHVECLDFLAQWLDGFSDPQLSVTFSPKHSSNPSTNDGLESADQQVQLRWISEDVALFKLSSFDANLKMKIEALIESNYSQLMRAKGLIVDLRGNDDGTFPTMYSALEIIDIKDYQSIWHVLSSENNTNYYDQNLSKMRRSDDPTMYSALANLVADMNQFPNTWLEYSWSRPSGKIALKNLEAIYIIQDETVAFAAEEFLIAAKKNDKVKTFGGATFGNLDYAEPISYPILDLYTAHIPSQKRVWYEHGPINENGLPPDVKIHASDEKLIGYLHDLMKLKIRESQAHLNL